MNSSTVIHITSLLMGVNLGIDGISSVFLSLTFFIWLISGIYAYFYMKGQKNISRFFLFYIITASGNIGLILAQDMVSFYLFFALMTFAAYPLVIHNGTAGARYAGKVYIIMAVIGEAMLISAIMMIAAEAESAAFSDITAAILSSGNQNIIISLILAGFGIKAGALFLHMWLPLAHPVAPTPASAVLSGVMIKAGLLGWIRFLPLGEISLQGWGVLCIAAGLTAAFYGVIAGLAQDNPKTVLAYSSISQMGIMTSGLGIGLSSPDLWPMAVTALLVYSMYHALNKAALFLGVGVVDRCSPSNRRAVFFFLLLPSFSLAGAPFTGGYISKSAFKNLFEIYNGFAGSLLILLLPLTSVATTILMGRFLFLMSAKEEARKVSGSAKGVWISWLVLLACTVAAGWFLSFAGIMNMGWKSHSIQNIISSLWPVFAGGIIWWAFWQLHKRSILKSGLNMPPGDLLVVIVMILRQVKTLRERNIPKLIETLKRAFPLKKPGLRTGVFVSDVIISAERNLHRWFVACIVFLFTVATLFVFIGH